MALDRAKPASFLDLAFDSEDMIRRLRPWIETESPTFDAEAVARMVDVVAYDAAAAGASLEVIPGRMGCGPSLRAKFPHADQGKPGILVSGHLDTVHPVGTLAQNPWRREGGRIPIRRGWSFCPALATRSPSLPGRGRVFFSSATSPAWAGACSGLVPCWPATNGWQLCLLHTASVLRTWFFARTRRKKPVPAANRPRACGGLLNSATALMPLPA